jgi:hypothetical protein
MKFNKVIFVRYFPLTEAVYRDLYFNELLQNNIEVEYLDVTNLFSPDRVSLKEKDFEGTIKINTYKQLEDYLRLQNKETTLFMSLMGFEWLVFRLFRLFTKHNLTLGVFGRGAFPSFTSDKKNEIKRILNVFSFERVGLFIANRLTILSKKRGYLKPYDYIFRAGEYGSSGFGIGSEIDNQQAKIIEVNTVDYDQFLLHKQGFLETENEYIVFLDQYLPYHPDALFLKIKTVEPEKYFKELNSFFDRLEEKTGKKVIIAAHPKADNYREFNPFNNRDIYFNQSNDLVKDAFLVLTHASTAVCFPICYQKKIILLVSDYLNSILPQFFKVAQSIEQVCGATIIAMNNDGDIAIPERIDIKKYDDFKYKYLTSKKSENQQSKDIFVNFLKNTNIIA